MVAEGTLINLEYLRLLIMNIMLTKFVYYIQTTKQKQPTVPWAVGCFCYISTFKRDTQHVLGSLLIDIKFYLLCSKFFFITFI